MSSEYAQERNRFCDNFCRDVGDEATSQTIGQSPLVSLAVKHAIDDAQDTTNKLTNSSSSTNSTSNNSNFAFRFGNMALSDHSAPIESASCLPQYGLLGFDLENRDGKLGNPEPILLNTNSPSSVFLCGAQGSGKSYTLSCMLENHLLMNKQIGSQRQAMPGFVFHYDTNTSGYLAEAASLCSRGIKVRLLVSWSHYQNMKKLYEAFAMKSGGKIEVRPLLFEDKELTVGHIRNLMAFNDTSAGPPPLYLEVIQGILRKYGRSGKALSVRKFLEDVDKEGFIPGQQAVLDQRLGLLKNFSASTAPDIVKKDLAGKGNKQQVAEEMARQGLGFQDACIQMDPGSLTIIDLSDPFVDPGTACTLFDICLTIILKRHRQAVEMKHISPGLIVTLDEAHKYLDKALPAAEVFTASLLTTIREQRHNAARVIVATQEPTISERLMDLCSMTIVHRFNSPHWFTTIREHLGGASSMVGDGEEGKKASAKRGDLFQRILALRTGESLVFSPTSWVRGGVKDGDGEYIPPTKLGSGVLLMKTRLREGKDAGQTMTAV